MSCRMFCNTTTLVQGSEIQTLTPLPDSVEDVITPAAASVGHFELRGEAVEDGRCVLGERAVSSCSSSSPQPRCQAA